jgi:CRP/FNR family transcriptional regulator, anaerobic regulatory protein
MNDLINVIDQKVKLTQSDIDLCQTFFVSVKHPKNTLLDSHNKIPDTLYFISKGYMRLFYLDDNGDEATTHINAPNSFITPFLSFINQFKAKESLQCVTDCELLKIARSDLATLIAKSDKFKAFSLIIFEQAINATETRANDLATLSAEQRYKKLLTNQPDILQNVPIQQIASYLGIKPESLSRIRRQIIN